MPHKTMNTQAITRQTIAEFAQAFHITAKVVSVEKRPDGQMGEMPRHFRVTLRLKLAGAPNRSMSLYFSQGSAHTEDPTLTDVLDCLASDYPYGTQSFEEFCGEFGYDADSRKAERDHKALVRATARLNRFLGVESAEDLAFNTERA